MKLTPQNMQKVVLEMRRQRDAEIRDLYQMYKNNKITGFTLEKLAEMYGLSKQRIQQIVKDEQPKSLK